MGETYSVINITEMTVDLYYPSIMEEEGCCMCERCMLDAKALSLNELPPKYVVTNMGTALETFRINTTQNKANVYQAILEAVNKVKSRPHHN